HEPVPRRAKPTCPSHLSPEAKKAWKRVVDEVAYMGLLTSADREALAVYAVAVARWQDASTLIDRTGILIKGQNGGFVRNPAIIIERDAARTIERMGEQF